MIELIQTFELVFLSFFFTLCCRFAVFLFPVLACGSYGIRESAQKISLSELASTLHRNMS